MPLGAKSMPYTAAQLTTYYTLVNQGIAPDANNALLLQAYGTPSVGAGPAAAAITDISSRIAFFQKVAAERAPGLNQDLATKAIVIGYILNEGVKADVGIYAKAIDQFNLDVAAGNAIYGPGT